MRIQPIAPDAPIDGHTHEPGRFCAGCWDLMYEEPLRLIRQLCKDLNQAHDEILKLQNCVPENFLLHDWPEWTPQANSIRWAERIIGQKLAKTNQWTKFPNINTDRAQPEFGGGGGRK
jgi:hypothetical protein